MTGGGHSTLAQMARVILLLMPVDGNSMGIDSVHSQAACYLDKRSQV